MNEEQIIKEIDKFLEYQESTSPEFNDWIYEAFVLFREIKKFLIDSKITQHK